VAIATKQTGVVLQSWVLPALAEQLKAQAENRAAQRFGHDQARARRPATGERGASMSWEIHVPYRNRDDSLIDVAIAAGQLEGEDGQVARQLAMDAIIDSDDRCAGDLIDRIERANPAERRALLDRTRINAGLLNTKDEEGHRAFVAANEVIARRPRPPVPACAVCGATPTTPGGMPAAVPRASAGHASAWGTRTWWGSSCTRPADSNDNEQQRLGQAVDGVGVQTPRPHLSHLLAAGRYVQSCLSVASAVKHKRMKPLRIVSFSC
jgi:hypothetical protein